MIRSLFFISSSKSSSRCNYIICCSSCRTQVAAWHLRFASSSASASITSPSSSRNLNELNSSSSSPLIKQEENLLPEELKTAFDYVAFQKRKELADCNLDSKGFNSFKTSVVDLSTIRRDELVWNLFQNILFCDSNLIAINKPPGLTVHDGAKRSKRREREVFLTDYLDDLKKLLIEKKKLSNLDSSPLHLIHRLDRSTSGTLLLATNKSSAAILSQAFKSRSVIKNYYCITRGIPEMANVSNQRQLKEGLIDIPLQVGCIPDGRQRMVLRPEVAEEYNRIRAPQGRSSRAVTYFKVVSTTGNAALIKVIPETGIKHQIRAHLGLGLRTPILGDHKYSDLVIDAKGFAPQKLPADMLLALNVRQAKVRNVPLHLHCSSIVIPEEVMREMNMSHHQTGSGLKKRGSKRNQEEGNQEEGGGRLVIKAPFPPFFRQSMKQLKLWFS